MYEVRFSDVSQMEYELAVAWYADQSPETAERGVVEVSL